MKNQKSVFIEGKEFITMQFFNCDPDESGVDVYDENMKHIGQILDLTIPDIDDIESNCHFDNEVENFLVENSKI